VELIARVGERVERVSVERDGGRYHVRIGERRYEVDHRALGPWVRSLVVDGESHEAAVFRAGEERWNVGWRGRTAMVELVDPLTHLAAEAHGEGKRGGRQVVTAYMPGRVVVISVEEGATVEPGQPLVVLEAMKMQNEIQADRAATVRKIHVRPGQAVEGGDPLLELG
jgi:acetyl/propionyl-CoA carboxylase alpha subunit